jgi:hypothetical protein
MAHRLAALAMAPVLLGGGLPTEPAQAQAPPANEDDESGGDPPGGLPPEVEAGLGNDDAPPDPTLHPDPSLGPVNPGAAQEDDADQPPPPPPAQAPAAPVQATPPAAPPATQPAPAPAATPQVPAPPPAPRAIQAPPPPRVPSRAVPPAPRVHPSFHHITPRPPASAAHSVSPPPATPSKSARSYRVQPGDTLWSIAGSLVGAKASPAQIARVVDQLWDLNAGRIGSGSADLVMAGTELALPDVEGTK